MSAARSATELAPAAFFADDFATVLAFAHARNVPFSSTPAVGFEAVFAFADGADFATVLVAVFVAVAEVGLVADDFLSTDCTDDTDFATGLGAVFVAVTDDGLATADFAADDVLVAVDFLAADDATAGFADDVADGFLTEVGFSDTDTPLFVPPIKNSIQ